MHIATTKNIDDLSALVASWITTYINKTLINQAQFSIVLSGGYTTRKLYQLLASAEYRDKIDWNRLHIFSGDERCVPASDDRSNAKMFFETLLDHVPIPSAQVHTIRTDIAPENSAAEYEQLLHEHFTGNTTFDLVLLGLGKDAHTLSLFPGYDVVQEQNRWVASFLSKEENIHRITLTAPAVNAAACVAFIVSGADKTAAVHETVIGEYQPEQFPAQLIQPPNEQVYWWLDEAAAADLK